MQQDTLWLVDGSRDAGHWTQVSAKTVRSLEALVGGREVELGQLAEFALRCLVDQLSASTLAQLVGAFVKDDLK